MAAPDGAASGAPDASPTLGVFDAGEAGTFDDAHIEAEAAQYVMFAKIDKTPYPTRQHAGNPLVDVYANAAAEATYRSIDYAVAPDGPVQFAPGSMLVKAMLDPSGAPPILTVMYKKAPGYDPSHDNWWYGRLNADGTPTDPSYVGTVDFCVSCHMGTAMTDYAWGIVASNK
jgi:hypothetical protein